MGEKEVEGKLVGEEAKGFWAKKVVHSERWDYCRSSSLRLPDAVIHHLVRGDRQHVLLLRQEQFVVLVEVEDERGEEGGSLSDVGEGPCHYFMNYYTPIYRHGSGHCSKQGVSHGKANPFGFVRIQDG